MTVFLETGRMVLRPLTAGDEDAVFALHSDPAVMRFLGPPATRARVRGRDLPRLLGGDEGRPDCWAAIERDSGAFLGWFLLRPTEQGTVELGYRLHATAWGRGLATEGAAALVARGFTELGVQRVVADTMAVNTGSRRVLEKVGLRLVRTFHYDGPDPLLPGAEHGDVEYALTRDEWATSAATPPPPAR